MNEKTNPIEPSELESIYDALFQELSEADPKGVLGEATHQATGSATWAPAGPDYAADYNYDWS